MTKQTVLNATHRALGAKMVDFGGWDMPIHYGSQIEEHHAVRRDAGGWHVEGDNGFGSTDSRDLGPAQVLGVVRWRLWPSPGRMR